MIFPGGDMIKIAIVEDEEESFLWLKEFAERYERERGEKVETRWFTDGMAFIDGYEAGEYTVVFMDIDMPHINGIETARELRKRDEFVPLIFVSIMVQYAIEGYSVDAMDFLVKPIQYLKFSMKLDKAVTYSRKNRSTVIKLTGEDGMTQYIVAGEITYVESVNHYVYFHTSHGVYKKLMSLSKAEQMLEGVGFLRSDVSFLVNPAYVTSLGKDSLMIGEQKIPISRNRKKEFMRKFTGYRKYVY